MTRQVTRQPIKIHGKGRSVEVQMLVEKCDEECGGYIVAIPDLPQILLHVDDPCNVADLILWLHRLSRPSELASASITRRKPTTH
jgi:hypothetical protein